MSVSETPDFSTGVAGSDQVDPTLDVPLVLGTHELKGRLVVGTGKYATYELMQECLEASGAEAVSYTHLRAHETKPNLGFPLED